MASDDKPLSEMDRDDLIRLVWDLRSDLAVETDANERGRAAGRQWLAEVLTLRSQLDSARLDRDEAYRQLIEFKKART